MPVSKAALEGKVGLFGGTFDPIHLGHLNLAIELKERANLKEVWFSPAAISPFRTNAPPCVNAPDRLALVKLAIEGLSSFDIYEQELNRPAPSYTFDTIKEILEKKGGASLVLLLGEDSLTHFDKWKEAEEITKLVPCLIGLRRGFDALQAIDQLDLSSKAKQKLKEGIVETPYMDISATSLRDRLKKRLYCGHLIPPKVLDYIYENQLYS